MAVTVTPVLAGATLNIADIEATADGDTGAVIPHGLPATPALVTLTPLLQVPASLSLWAVTGIDGTNVTLSKSVTAGSGAGGDQVRMIAAIPHSLFL